MSDISGNFKGADKQTFIKFIHLLGTNVEDVQGYYGSIQLNVNAGKPDRSIFACIFKGAKIYE